MEKYGESKERHSSEGPYGHNQPQYDTTPILGAGHHREETNINSGGTNYGADGTRTTIHNATGEGHDIGGTKYDDRKGYEGKHDGGILHRSRSTGSSSSSEDDGEGGRRKKKGLVGKIKQKLPGGGHQGGNEQYPTSGAATHGGNEQYPTSGAATHGGGHHGGNEQYPTSGAATHGGGHLGSNEQYPTSGAATHGGGHHGGNEQYPTSGTTNVSGGGYGEEVPEKKGMIQKIKEKLPGNH